MSEERWKDIPGYNGFYQASNKGRIRSFRIDGIRTDRRKKPRIISGIVDQNGYRRLHLSKNGSAKGIYAHRLIALTFIPNPHNKPFINHKNGVKDDNKVGNLEWCTYEENMKHAVETGLQPISYGEDTSNAKLTSRDVIGIREMYSTGDFSQKEVAKEFKTDQGTVSKIINRKLWGTV